MLSRASSDAGLRLRRAKSSSSASHRSLGISIPVVDPRHAEMAAVEAYRRAHKYSDPVDQDLPSAQAQAHKRQSRMLNRSEGSHFEGSRNGQRVGNTRRKDRFRANISAKSPSLSTNEPARDTSAMYEGTIVTRSRRVVNTMGYCQKGPNIHGESRISSTTNDYGREAKSSHHEPSMEENSFSSNSIRRSSCYPDTPDRTAIKDKDSGSTDLTVWPLAISRKPTPREMQTDDSIKVAAWDAYLQDFHQRKLNVRKSFIAPIKRRLTRETLPTKESLHDTSVPPYNLAGESDDVFAPSPIPPVETMEPIRVSKSRRTRTVSDSLKSKFQKLMGKSKRVQSEIPAQHVHSQTFHFGPDAVMSNNWSSESQYKLSSPPAIPSPHGTIGTRQSSSRSSHSNRDAATMKSRVTSWTNSTGTGTHRVSSQGAPLCSIDETSTVAVASDARIAETKPGHGSFLSRALRLPQRRQSRIDLNRSSEDSNRLYDALRKQIQGPEEFTSNTLETTINDDVVATDTLLKEYLPPRYKDGDGVAQEAKIGRAISTIRPVQSDSSEGTYAAPRLSDTPLLPPPEPPMKITRKSSWFGNARLSLPSQNIVRDPSQNASHWPSQSAPRLEKDNEPVANVPSQELISNRHDKSQNRWQSTLEDQSPIQSRAMRYGVDEDNPYKLRSVTSTPQVDYLPIAVCHNKMKAEYSASKAPRTVLPIPSARDQVISPSVYSRTTECRSTTPSGGPGEHGTFITVTGREVKRYSLDSPSKNIHQDNYVIKPSHEWKTWLNTELRDFSATPAPEQLSLTGQTCLEAKHRASHTIPDVSGHVHQPAERLNSGEDTSSCKEYLPTEPPINFTKTRRPELRARRSSIMNERYPLVDTGRVPSSDRGTRTGRRPEFSSRQSSSNSRALTTAKGTSSGSSAMQRERDEHPTPVPMMGRPRIRERHSAAMLGGTRKRPSLIASSLPPSYENNENTTAKTKSALDLRAVYRTTNEPGSCSINVRRMPIEVVLQDDETLRKISEGPYGRVSPANKENDVPPTGSSLSVAGKLAYDTDGSSRPPSRRTNSRAPSRASTLMPISTGTSIRGKDSPGQRMVDDWLSARSSVGRPSAATGFESSPAFI